MIDLEFLQSLIRALDESGLDSLEIERGGTRIRLSKSAPPAPVVATNHAGPAGEALAVSPPPEAGGGSSAPLPAAAEAAAENPGAEAPAAEPEAKRYVDVTSPMVGTFYRAPAPDAPPFVEVGRRVKPGDTLCIIEAMKLMNELECEVEGTIAEILVENAEPVEFGQVLFRIDPA